MDKALWDILNSLLDGVEGHPLGDDSKRVVLASDLKDLRDYVNELPKH